MKKAAGLALLALLLFVLTGCATLMEEGAVRAGVREILPGTTANGMQETTDEDGDVHRLYSFTHEGVTFTLENYQYHSAFFGASFQATSTRNTYARSVYEAYEAQLAEIAERHGVTIECDSDEAFRIVNEPERFSELGRGVDALEEVCGLLESYLPTAAIDWFDFSITLHTACEKTNRTEVVRRGETDYAYERELLRLNFADYIRSGEVTQLACTGEELADIPVKTLRALSINGREFTSERYDTRILYNLREGKYYTIVCFGTKLDYNGGVEDYLQREILESYYPDCAYTIEDGTTIYRIGGDSYRVDRGEDGLTFYRNGERLPIEAVSEVDRQSTGATYYYWIPLDDFASLLGMRVERVTDEAALLVTARP